MAKIHLLDSPSTNVVNAVARFAVPTGNNSVSVPWKTAYLASFGSGAPASVLPVGSGTGKISQAEANSIGSGDLIELPFQYGDDPNLSTAARQVEINRVADVAIAEFQTRFATQYKFYGYTQG